MQANMQRNFKITIEYDGTRYHGWQRQPNGRSIQQEIETALSIMTRQAVTLTGSGRTDAGVHARGQVANFRIATRLPAMAFHKGLNSILPDDIVVHECVEAHQDFHARFDVKSKRYRYSILNRELPAAIGRQYLWWIRKPLNLDSMRMALAHLIGTRDFKAFEGTGSPRAHTIRTVMHADVSTGPDAQVFFDIEADGFLRFMVRNIVGTLVLVGHGRQSAEAFGAILTSLDRTRAGATAPPQGLCLMKVNY